MLQTSTNQLSLEQIVLKHRQLAINELTKAGYADIITDKNNENTIELIVDSEQIPIVNLFHYDMDIDTYDAINEAIYVSSYQILCDMFSTKDILSFTKWYISLIKNNSYTIPDIIKQLNGKTLESGQLAEIISAYLTQEEN